MINIIVFSLFLQLLVYIDQSILFLTFPQKQYREEEQTEIEVYMVKVNF